MLLTIAALALMIAQQKAPSAGQVGGALFFSCVCPILVLSLISVPLIIAWWKVFVKAGEPGWACIVPVYNYMVFARICGKDEMYGLLLLVPFVNIVIGILLMIELAKAFGKDTGFAIGLILLGYIFIMILGFGSSEYIGPEGKRRRRRRRDEDDDDDDYDSRAPRMRRRDSDRVRRSEEDVEEDRPRRRRRPRDDDDD
jgi:hypothetical protein